MAVLGVVHRDLAEFPGLALAVSNLALAASLALAVDLALAVIGDSERDSQDSRPKIEEVLVPVPPHRRALESRF